MGNSAWVCFDCREAVRRLTQYRGEVSCPKCARPCRCLGYKIPVPPKRNVGAWERLRKSLDEERVRGAEAQHASAIRRRHDIEQEIRDLESKPANAGRAKAVRLLKRRLGGA
jgi:hypothetical protein